MTKRRALTLWEILITMVIIGILAAIIVPQLSFENSLSTAEAAVEAVEAYLGESLQEKETSVTLNFDGQGGALVSTGHRRWIVTEEGEVRDWEKDRWQPEGSLDSGNTD